ncbi:MAG: WD40 repeat domain-containing protein [Actinomycetaceae bacterium]|nr:WD40 repeat domain-containing protein [Actinomycetaceae bacterium]
MTSTYDAAQWRLLHREYPPFSPHVTEVDIDVTVTACAPLSGPNGEGIIALGTLSGEIFLWDLRSEQIIGQPLRGHSDKINALVSWNGADGSTYLASADDEIAEKSSICVWKLFDEKPEVGSLVGHTYFSDALTYFRSRQGNILLVATDQISVRVWDPLSGKEIACRQRVDTDYADGQWFFGVEMVSLSSGEPCIAIADNSCIRILDAESLATLYTLPGDHKDTISDLSFFSERGRSAFLASVARNGSIIIHRLHDNSEHEVRPALVSRDETPHSLTFFVTTKEIFVSLWEWIMEKSGSGTLII